MTESGGQQQATAEVRKVAVQVAHGWLVDDGYPLMGPLYDRIAAALVEAARADQELRARVEALIAEEPTVQPLWEFERGILRGIEMVKTELRAALEDPR